MKNRFLLLLTITLLLAVSAVPLAANAQSGSIMTRNADGHTITAWGWDTLDFNKPVLAYLKDHSGVTVNDLVFAHNDIMQKLTVSAAAGGAGMPDVFKLTSTNIPQLVEMGAVKDITDLVAPYKDLLPDVAWKMVTYNGKIWGVPANSPAGGLFWRSDVVSQYGIDPTKIQTWADFMDASNKLSTASNGKVALIQTTSVGLPWPIGPTIQQQHQAELIGSDLKVKIGPNSAEWLATLKDWRAVKDNIKGAEMDQWTQPWYQAIKDGSIAVFPSGTWFVETIIQQAPDSKGKWFFTPFPAVAAGGDQYPNFGSATCFISSASKDPTAGMEWVKAWTMEPASTLGIGLKDLGISVISKAALNDSYVIAPHEYFSSSQAYWRVATEAFSKSTYVPPVTKFDSQANDIFNRYAEQWWQKKITDQQFLQSVSDELTKLVNS